MVVMRWCCCGTEHYSIPCSLVMGASSHIGLIGANLSGIASAVVFLWHISYLWVVLFQQFATELVWLCGAQIPARRPPQFRLLKKRERTVNRAYGGTRCHSCVREK